MVVQAFATWMRHVDEQLETLQQDRHHHRGTRLMDRIEALEAKPQARHWGVTDGEPDPTVQLRRDVGVLVRAVRTALDGGLLREADVKALMFAIEPFAGDYT
jgi:hypothetical protein